MADEYSAGSGEKNAYASVSSVVTAVSSKCVNALMPKGTTCGSGSSNNAVQVTQSAKLNTFFMALFGVRTLTVVAQATASMQGSSLPWNVAIIVDSTGSMATADSNCGGVTQFQCALGGVQSLLEATNPCPTGVTGCSGSSANVRMSLFTFPNVLISYNGTTVNSVSDDINCNGVPATWTTYSSSRLRFLYTLPIPGQLCRRAGCHLRELHADQHRPCVEGDLPDYSLFERLLCAFSFSGLNSSSSLVKAVGNGSTSGCLTYTFGIWGTGNGSGFGNTYVASSIYAAQSALASEQSLYGGQNAIILLSDGGMNASYYSKNSRRIRNGELDEPVCGRL